MPSRVFIAPYKMASESAKALAQRMNVKRVALNKTFKRSDVIINWGRSGVAVGTQRVLNPITAVERAAGKLTTFRQLAATNVNTVPFTTNKQLAKQWLDSGEIVIARLFTNSSKGRGIKVLGRGEWVDAPLYTLYIQAEEYRVHVVGGKVIDLQKKKCKTDVEAHPFIKNLDNGWAFCKTNTTAPLNVYTTATQAVENLGLDFGAVDMLCKEGQAYVLEVNTAPGIAETTLDNYARALEELCVTK